MERSTLYALMESDYPIRESSRLMEMSPALMSRAAVAAKGKAFKLKKMAGTPGALPPSDRAHVQKMAMRDGGTMSQNANWLANRKAKQGDKFAAKAMEG